MNSPQTTLTADEDLVRRARRRVDMKMGFYVHLLVFALVNTGLWALNAYHGGTRWHGWPLMGWGLGLTIHGIVTFIGLSGEGMRQRMMATEIERLKRSDR